MAGHMLEQKPQNIDLDYFEGEFADLRDLWLEKVSRTFTLSIRIPCRIAQVCGARLSGLQIT